MSLAEALGNFKVELEASVERKKQNAEKETQENIVWLEENLERILTKAVKELKPICSLEAVGRDSFDCAKDVKPDELLPFLILSLPKGKNQPEVVWMREFAEAHNIDFEVEYTPFATRAYFNWLKHA